MHSCLTAASQSSWLKTSLALLFHKYITHMYLRKRSTCLHLNSSVNVFFMIPHDSVKYVSCVICSPQHIEDLIIWNLRDNIFWTVSRDILIGASVHIFYIIFDKLNLEWIYFYFKFLTVNCLNDVSAEVRNQTRPDKPFAVLFPINQKHHVIDVERKIIVHNCKKKSHTYIQKYVNFPFILIVKIIIISCYRVKINTIINNTKTYFVSFICRPVNCCILALLQAGLCCILSAFFYYFFFSLNAWSSDIIMQL